MNRTFKFFAVASLIIVAALMLGACSAVRFPVAYQPTPATGYGYGPGMMGGGMMSGGGMMGGVPGGMMGGYGYNQSAPTAEPTPIGATPVPVDEEIQITATNLRFAPTQITVKPGETVRFVVTNNDPYLHNFVGEQAGIPFLNLPGNTTQTVMWIVPAQTGAYTAVCTLHPGMSLSIIVKD
ncbi:MAG: cupredoxin domain-containing protein [Chloroflexota bacterium]